MSFSSKQGVKLGTKPFVVDISDKFLTSNEMKKAVASYPNRGGGFL